MRKAIINTISSAWVFGCMMALSACDSKARPESQAAEHSRPARPYPIVSLSVSLNIPKERRFDNLNAQSKPAEEPLGEFVPFSIKRAKVFEQNGSTSFDCRVAESDLKRFDEFMKHAVRRVLAYRIGTLQIYSNITIAEPLDHSFPIGKCFDLDVSEIDLIRRALDDVLVKDPSTNLGKDESDAKPNASALLPNGGPLSWAEILQRDPDPNIIQDITIRNAIIKSGLPWRVRDRQSRIEFILVPNGEFIQGAIQEDADAQTSEIPRHKVIITKPFYMGRFEVQVSEWLWVLQVVGKSNSLGMPKSNISWNNAQQWLAKVPGMRLPTEAEWEYACRAMGTDTSSRCSELNDVAWYMGNTRFSGVHRVGMKAPNGLGLFDMFGNLEEWCSDWYSISGYNEYAKGVSDPTGPPSGIERVVRGGSYSSDARLIRNSCRAHVRPEESYPSRGIRVVRNP